MGILCTPIILIQPDSATNTISQSYLSAVKFKTALLSAVSRSPSSALSIQFYSPELSPLSAELQGLPPPSPPPDSRLHRVVSHSTQRFITLTNII